jgi:hypothetical protein
MGSSALHDRRRPFLLAALAVTVGCADVDADEASSTEAALTAALAPAYWNVDAAPDSPTPGSEPLNVIVTTEIPFDAVLEALRWPEASPRGPLDPQHAWQRVEIGVGFDFVTSFGRACISAEKATIDGPPGSASSGRHVQPISLRLGGCAGVLFPGHNHARAWESVARRKTSGGTVVESTWYLSVSKEEVCDIVVGGRPTKWHCIQPNRAAGTALGGGYNDGRDAFVTDLRMEAAARGWGFACAPVRRPEGAGLRARAVGGALPPVKWDGTAVHCRITQS